MDITHTHTRSHIQAELAVCGCFTGCRLRHWTSMHSLGALTSVALTDATLSLFMHSFISPASSLPQRFAATTWFEGTWLPPSSPSRRTPLCCCSACDTPTPAPLTQPPHAYEVSELHPSLPRLPVVRRWSPRAAAEAVCIPRWVLLGLGLVQVPAGNVLSPTTRTHGGRPLART